jgi:hypothetical protein
MTILLAIIAAVAAFIAFSLAVEGFYFWRDGK